MAKDDEWDSEEIEIAVEQYVEVLRRGGAKKLVSKDIFWLEPKSNCPDVIRVPSVGECAT